MKPVPHTAVTVNDNFWAPRLRTNRTQTLAAQYKHLKRIGHIDGFRLDWKPGMPKQPHVFWSSDVAKWIEAVSYTLATKLDPALARLLDSVIDLIISAQHPDGYLNIYYSTVEPGKRWTNLRDQHELYGAGHLMEAAVAHFQATGQRKLLDCLCRYADHIGQTFGRGPGQKRGYCGHEEIELALVKLYRATGERRYLKLSQYFVEERGRKPHYFDQEARARGEDPKAWNRPNYSYCQALTPVRQQTHVTGHAVRAMYLYSAVADLATELNDAELRAVNERLWKQLTTRQLSLTGGIGAWPQNEGFGFEYDLPNEKTYNETCAAIGLVLWNHRLLQFDCDRRYADLMERALYNGVLSGISLDGKKYFYENPLASQGHHHRQEWFGCACCPPNIARLLASLGGYIYSQQKSDMAVHLYVQSRVELPGLVLRQETNYPWDGRIKIHVEPEHAKRFNIRLRIPAWCHRATLRVNGRRMPVKLQHGYASISRLWEAGDKIELDLAMPVERVYSNPRLRYNNGRVALQRGPVVYCLEEVDNDPQLNALALPVKSKLTTHRERDFVSIRGEALRTMGGEKLYQSGLKAKRVRFKAIPYALWDNRAPGEMLVWLREVGA